MNESLKQELESTFKDILVTDRRDNLVSVIVKRGQVLAVLRFLKDKGFDHLALLSAVDWIKEKEFELVYILTRYVQSIDDHTNKSELHLIVKTRISREEPQFETITSIFPNAEPYEREIHELFGVVFEGNNRLVPLFLDKWKQIPPFRKDFDSRKYVTETFGDARAP